MNTFLSLNNQKNIWDAYASGEQFSTLIFPNILTNYSEDEGVGEVSVQRQLHWVSPEFQGLYGLCKTDKYLRSRQGNNVQLSDLHRL